MTRLLYYGESPLNPTGFGTVNRHILAACAELCDVTLVATTHYYPDYDRVQFPYTIIPTEERTDQRNLPNIHKALDSLDWDIFFYQGDMGPNNDILQKVGNLQKEHPEKDTIFYMPVDGDISLGFAFTPFTWCSAPVVYTHHAKSVVQKYAPEVAEKVSVIWLGCDTQNFYPLSEEECLAARLELFGEMFQDTFICVNVNRNQLRKDIARCMACFHTFHVKHQDSMLYLHSVQNDAGGSLPLQAQLVGCKIWEKPAEIAFSGLDLANPWGIESVNKLYNAIAVRGCLVSTAYGEGWGLTTSEAMSCRLSVAVPYNTANLDLLGPNDWSVPFSAAYERGYGIQTGGDIDHTTYNYANGGGPVPHVHERSFVNTLDYIYNHPEDAHTRAITAYQWTQHNTWKERQAEWIGLLKAIKERQAHG